ncbi:uncharacterized protein LOC130409444 isoform X2 [Triplophysa dalaica]|uniref:uncharacterized protein LOC130409444 isoform X2 n=1 Tax=Triplophysa dalaica TaxID=1582913 RepID=UPI0024DFF121|nr:uncharacterized protein LOC130409444 isoform X2 [Triplophysa dalaica]
MKTYFVLLHVFVFLLMFDYGMFSTSSSSSSSLSSQESPTASSNIPTNITMTTAQSITESESSVMIRDNPTTSYSGDEDDNNNTTSVTNTQPNVSLAILQPGVMNPTPGIIKDNSGPVTGGVIILILILILIILLLGILYVLRRKGRSYSFDLTRSDACANEYDTPLREQQGISYESTNKDMPVSLDYMQDDKCQEKTSPILNGCANETTEQTDALESDQNLPEENSFPSSPGLTPPIRKVEFNLDLDMISGEFELNTPTSADTCDASLNENNNNIFYAGLGPAEEIFTEISLDEPKEQV